MLGMNYMLMLNNHAGYYKRATAIGINMTLGNCAGLVIGQIFKNTTPEGRYLEGEASSAAVAGFSIFVIALLWWYIRRQIRIKEALTPEERQRWIDEGRTGDYHPDFKYIL
jgi:hypothetical protein